LAVLSSLTAGTVDVQLPETADTPVLIAEAYAWHETLLAQHRALYHSRTVYWLEQGAASTAVPSATPMAIEVTVKDRPGNTATFQSSYVVP
jgi:hypothetical protein